MNATERQTWLESRQKGIGSSDVAPILGLSPWKSALDVYLDKVQPFVTKKMAPHLEWGLRHEPSIAAAVMDHHGWTLRKIATIAHADYPFLLSSADRVNQDDEICEFKTSRIGEGFGEPDSEDIPDYYWLQCQHQMEIAASHGGKAELCWMFVLIGGSDFRRYRIPRDNSYLPTVIDPLEEFWKAVESRTPPEPDWRHESTVAAVNRLFQPKPPTVPSVAQSATDAVPDPMLDTLIAECERRGEWANFLESVGMNLVEGETTIRQTRAGERSKWITKINKYLVPFRKEQE